MEYKVIVKDSYIRAKERLPENIRENAEKLPSKIRLNPFSNGINMEAVQGALDGKMCSARIDQGYRAIVARFPGNVLLMLWADSHDKAYRWAEKRICDVNPETGLVQDYSSEQPPVARKYGRFFGYLSELKLLRLGVPETWIDYVRSIDKAQDLEKIEDKIPSDVYGYLENVVKRFWTYDEVLTEAEDDRKRLKEDSKKKNILPIARSIIVTDDDERFPEIMNGPLEDWRVFLRSEQEDFINADFKGSAKVLGSAGTGKTVVAMHRAWRLAKQCSITKPEILYTVYNLNIAEDIRANLKRLCPKEVDRIKITSLDKWIEKYLKEAGFTQSIVYDETVLKDLWNKAIESVPADVISRKPELGQSKFYIDEWSMLIVPNELFDEDSYLNLARAGRGSKLSKPEKRVVWSVIKSYMDQLAARNWFDGPLSRFTCKEHLESHPGNTRFKHIIVDEGQDFGNLEYKIIRAIAGPEHENDIFIVADPCQRIYGRETNLSRCGINTKDDSYMLTTNYRVTEETREFAEELLQNNYFNDLDGHEYIVPSCTSLLHGPKPQFLSFSSQNEEVKFIADEIKRLKYIENVKLSDICVVARRTTLVRKYMGLLKRQKVDVYDIPREEAEDREHESVRISTMHRVKGLEYRYIFVVSANEDVTPPRDLFEDDGMTNKSAFLKAERSLLYVALTRVNCSVYVTCYGKATRLIESDKAIMPNVSDKAA